jgi:hypothetical protein
VLVDWQNLRLSLASARRRAGPAWVLRALVDEICGILPDLGPPAGTTVRLFMTPATEHRADRVLLEAATFTQPAVTVEVRCLDGDLVGIELALQAADAWHGQPDGTIAVVTDAGRFATVVRHYEDRLDRRPPWLLHLHDRPPASRGGPATSGDARPPAATRRLRLPLDRPASTREWNRWDGPAWALRRLAARTDATVARRSLHAGASGQAGDLWREADLLTGVRLEQLEPVDHLVADLWRLAWGDPFQRASADDEAARRLAVGESDAAAAVDALLVAQFLRWYDAEHLEVPSSWREGLLLPMRRAVLCLALQPDRTLPLAELARQHRQRFLRRRRQAGAPEAARHRRVEHESRVDSWRWVRWALLEHLRIVEERTDWSAGGAVWTLTHSGFASDTLETARRICARLARPVAADRLEARLEREDGIARPSRWLRCLWDVGLVRQRGDRWELGRSGRDLHLP